MAAGGSQTLNLNILNEMLIFPTQLNKTQDRVLALKHRTADVPREQSVWQLDVLNDCFVFVPTRLDRIRRSKDRRPSVQRTDDSRLGNRQSLLLLLTDRHVCLSEQMIPALAI